MTRAGPESSSPSKNKRSTPAAFREKMLKLTPPSTMVGPSGALRPEVMGLVSLPGGRAPKTLSFWRRVIDLIESERISRKFSTKFSTKVKNVVRYGSFVNAPALVSSHLGLHWKAAGLRNRRNLLNALWSLLHFSGLFWGSIRPNQLWRELVE